MILSEIQIEDLYLYEAFHRHSVAKPSVHVVYNTLPPPLQILCPLFPQCIHISTNSFPHVPWAKVVLDVLFLGFQNKWSQTYNVFMREYCNTITILDQYIIYHIVIVLTSWNHVWSRLWKYLESQVDIPSIANNGKEKHYNAPPKV